MEQPRKVSRLPAATVSGWACSIFLSAVAALLFGTPSWASFVIFEAAGVDPAAISPTVDSFRAAVGATREEINWDGVPASFSDSNAFPADFFNVNSPRGVEFSTPGTGFLVSANAGEFEPILFGFPNDFQTFSPQKLFTAVNSNVTDIHFFEPGTDIPATTSAFGLVFVDVEAVGQTTLQFFDESNNQIFSRTALVGGNQGLTFLGAVANAGESISRVRITAGLNTIVSNGLLGNPNDDVVVMDDFIFAVPAAAIPEPATLALFGLGLAGLAAMRRRR